MPTTPILTFSGTARLDPFMDAEDAIMIDVALVAASAAGITRTYPQGTILGEVTATPGTYGAYASGNSDGTQNPAVILVYEVTVDHSGNLWFGTSATGEFGQQMLAAPAYQSGTFRIQDLTGLDAHAVSAWPAHIVEGAVGGTGIVRFG